MGLQKLKSLKKDITNWNKDEFGKSESRKSKALNDPLTVEQTSVGRQLSTNEAELMTSSKPEIQQLPKVERITWRQKSGAYG